LPSTTAHPRLTPATFAKASQLIGEQSSSVHQVTPMPARIAKWSKQLRWLLPSALLLAAQAIWFASHHRPVVSLPPLAIDARNISDGLYCGHFNLRVNLPLNDETTVYFCIPVANGSGQPLRQASNLVFYAPYNGEGIIMGRTGMPDKLRRLAKATGFTVFTMKILAGSGLRYQPKVYYTYPQSGWFDLVFELKAHLEREFCLECKPLCAVGESAGGSMIERMLVKYPDRFDAVAWNGGTAYDMHLPDQCRARILVFNTEGCPGTRATTLLVKEARQRGFDIHYATLRSTLTRADGWRDNHNALPCTERQYALFLANQAGFEAQWGEFLAVESVRNYELEMDDFGE
jgi:hypothetical protein